ncbi:MAG: patatin-like phospholipase family protein [Acidobacteriota bacterium]
MTPERADRRPRVALVLTGGGARGAYQVGVLRGLGMTFPDLRFPILTGVSAGAINAVYLALRPEPLGETSRRLVEIWRGIEIDDVIRGDWSWLTGNFLRWGARLGLGGHGPKARALLDTAPLRRTLAGFVQDPSGQIGGIDRNIEAGRLDAIALSAVHYGTGQTVQWVQAKEGAFEPWSAPNRVARRTRLTLDHVMASSSLPLIFPAVQLRDGWYGDGGIRMAAPLSPALRLGADRLLVISTRYPRSLDEARQPVFQCYPSPAQIGGHLMNSIFLDLVDQDIARLERINELVARLPPERRGKMRLIDFDVVRPSADLGKMTENVTARLPKGFRFLHRGLGSGDPKSPDFLSLLMFQSDYMEPLIDLGIRDALARSEDFRRLLEPEDDSPSAVPDSDSDP